MKKQEVKDLDAQAFWIKVLAMAERGKVGKNWEDRLNELLGLVVYKEYPKIRKNV